MISKIVCVGILLSIMSVSYINAQQDDFLVLEGFYLGQEPPGKNAEVLAPNLLTLEPHDSPGI